MIVVGDGQLNLINVLSNNITPITIELPMKTPNMIINQNIFFLLKKIFQFINDVLIRINFFHSISHALWVLLSIWTRSLRNIFLLLEVSSLLKTKSAEKSDI